MSRSSISRRRIPARRSQLAFARGARGRGLDDLDGVGFERPRKQAGGGLSLAELRLAHTADHRPRNSPSRRPGHRRPGRSGLEQAQVGLALGGAWQGAGRGAGRSVHSARASGSSGTGLRLRRKGVIPPAERGQSGPCPGGAPVSEPVPEAANPAGTDKQETADVGRCSSRDKRTQ